MWVKAGILGESGSRCWNSAVWTMAGLGMAIGLYSCSKWVEYSNRRKLGEENDNGIDRLSDDILCNIVSRLGTPEASRTSILSRRWRNIWTMKPQLMFPCLGTLDVSKRTHDHIVAYSDRQRFFKAVNHCLQLYSGRNLKSFILHCCFLNDHTCQLVRWMQTLARLDIEDLYLGVCCRTCGIIRWLQIDKPFTFSFKLIDGFSKLDYLDLRLCYVETDFVSQCTSLTAISLLLTSLSSDQLSDIFMSCPNLTSLFLERCGLPPNLTISGPNLKLMFLEISDCPRLQKLEISDINIVSIMIHMTHRQVEVLLSSVPKLKSLDLRTAEINYCFADNAPKQMPQLNYLSVQPKYQVTDYATVDVCLSVAQTKIVGLPPTFQVFGNVRILHLTTTVEEVDLWNFAPVLVECPLLEKFYLLVGGPACKEERKGEWPVLQHKHLEYMEWSGFSGTRNELQFAKFIATSAQLLQTLLLRLCCRGYDDGKGPYFEDEKDSEKIDPRVALAYLLKDYFLSEHTALKIELPK